MIPLHRDPFYRFPFADARRVDRFHLDGAEPGRAVTVLDLTTDAVLAAGTVGPGGWVTLPEPLAVAPGGGFRVQLRDPA